MHPIITAKHTAVEQSKSLAVVTYRGLEVLRYDRSKRLCVVRALPDNAVLCRINQALCALRLPQRVQLRADRVDLELATPNGVKVIDRQPFPMWNEPGACSVLRFTAEPVVHCLQKAA